jgi:hypothetical protein
MRRAELLLVAGSAAGALVLGWLWYRRRMCPASPGLGPVEPLAPSEPVAVYDPTEKPGVQLFRDWWLQTWGGRDGGIVRVSAERIATSAHNEGRAWDWFPPDRATADAALACLFDDDHELARRAGIRNVIWWGRSWSAGGVAAGGTGWSAYKYADSTDDTLAHRDHVHFAFSWAGARGETSLQRALSEGEMGELEPVDVVVLGELAQTIVPAERTTIDLADLRRALAVESGGNQAALRAVWSLVGHETDQTRSAWGFNWGNIACTKNFPTCHRLNVADPAKEPTLYRSYATAEEGAADLWRLLRVRYPLALAAAEAGDLAKFALELKRGGYYGQDANVYYAGLMRHAADYDRRFVAAGGSPLAALLVVGLLGGALYLGSAEG